MIAVRITLNVLPKKQLELIETLFSLIKPVGKEHGCKLYKVYRDIKDENSFCLFEEWGTYEDLEQHIKTLHFRVLLGTKTLLRKPPEIRIYNVSQTQGMEAVMAIKTKDVL